MTRYEFLRLATFAGFLISVGFLFVWADRPEIRYQEDWTTYLTTYGEEGPIDVAAFGSSRAARGFSAAAMARELKKQLGRPVVVYDLGRSHRGLDHSYLLIRDLLERRPVKHLVVEYVDHHSRRQVHDIFNRKARLADFMTNSFCGEPEKPVLARVNRSLSAALFRTTLRLQQQLTGDLRRRDEEEIKPAATFDTKPTSNGTEPDGLAEREEELRDGWLTVERRDWSFDEPLEHRSTHYVEEIIRLAERHGCTLTFISYPRTYEPLLADTLVEKFENRFGKPLLQIPEEVLLRNFEGRGYSDRSHMRIEGRTEVMKWLAPELAPYLQDR